MPTAQDLLNRYRSKKTDLEQESTQRADERNDLKDNETYPGIAQPPQDQKLPAKIIVRIDNLIRIHRPIPF